MAKTLRSLLSSTLACLLLLPFAHGLETRGPSTAEERTRALATIDDLETNPVGPNAVEERKWIMIFLIQVPDLHVAMCSGLVPELPKDSPEANLIQVQPTISSARYAVQHGGGSSISIDEYMAGVEGTLITYQNLIKVKPEDRIAAFDDLLKLRESGGLAKYVKTHVNKNCRK